MTPTNRVVLMLQAWVNIASMPPDARRQARGLIIMLAASPLARLARRIDFGMVSEDGLTIWIYQGDDFWLSYIENPDGSLSITSIWPR